ncbi:MAG: OmpA family protein [Deltaproteobacteria bacterium]
MSIARALVAVATLGASLGAVTCGPPPAPVDTVAISAQIYRDELAFARNALARHEWAAARARLEAMRTAVGPADPAGADARAMLAEVAFELGDYEHAAAVAAEVPEGSSARGAALEAGGLAALFRCEFDVALAMFYRLVPIDPARAHVWLGVTYAWTGAEANAERELQQVVQTYGASEHAPNARFYLVQLALWGKHDSVAVRRATELESATPAYVSQLGSRAENWLARRTHLLRAYFTFDTLARVADQRLSADGETYHQNAATALQLLQASPGTCAAPVARLAGARAEYAAVRAALVQRRAAQATDQAAIEVRTRDTDGDGIPDVRDRCPAEAETLNGVSDADGCPESTAAIQIVGNQIQIRAGFEFRFEAGDDHPLQSSYPVVEQLAGVLRSPEYAWIRTISIEGHTDDVGSDQTNMELSQRRVLAIGAALVARGVPRDKLNFAWFGESRPLDGSGTDVARATNRRVEFFITAPASIAGVRY